MWFLVLRGELLYGHAVDLLEKNLCLYLLMEVWLVIRLVIHAHKELKRLKCFRYAQPFE